MVQPLAESICRFYSRSSRLLFRQDVVKTFSGETLRQFRVVLSLAVGILVWALVFAGCSGSNTIAITLSPASGESLNPGATATITATLTHDTNNQGVSWTLSGPGQLSGNTTTSVVYTAPSSISTAATATITATSVANSTITATESITLNAVLTITTTSLPSGTLQTAYNTFVSATGATGTFTWSVTAGSLPPGLTFQTSSSSTSAEITGTPTVLGTYKFTVQVTDSSGSTVTQALSITINPEPPLAVATGSLPNGQVGTAYDQPLQASSGTLPYTWSLINGTLPIGLSLTASNGVISGTAIASGTFNFEVQVVDSSTPQQSASANLSITINPGPTNNARLSGYYAFSVRGFDANGLFVAAGDFFSDGKGNIPSGIMDLNQTVGSPTNPSFTGTYYVGQSGLGYMTLNISGGGARSFAFSIMAGGNANIIEFDTTSGGTRNSGVLLQQTTPFSTAEINSSYVFGFAGIDSGKNRFAEAGYFAADGMTGTISSGVLDSDDSSSGVATSVPFTGAYSVDASTGRGTATIANAQYSFYVVNSGELLVVGIDPFVSGGNPLVSGTILQQTSPSLTGAGVFQVTALEPSASVAESQVGVFSASGGTFSMSSDQNTGGTVTPVPLVGTGTYAVGSTPGRVTLTLVTGSGFQNSNVQPPQNDPVLYFVSNNEAFIVGTDTAVSFGFMAAQQSGFTLSGTYAGGSLPPVDPAVSSVVSIAIAGTNTLDLTQDINSSNGLSVVQSSDTTAVSAGNPDRIVVTETGSTVEILYLVSPQEFFALDAAAGDTTARVDIFQQ